MSVKEDYKQFLIMSGQSARVHSPKFGQELERIKYQTTPRKHYINYWKSKEESGPSKET